MGSVKKRTVRMLVRFMILSVLAGMMPAAAWAEPVIEQVMINMPDVKVGYRDAQGEPEAYLGGEKLTAMGAPRRFEDTGEPLAYYVLLDISGSLSKERFADIKTSLQSFADSLRAQDRLVLITFGDSVTGVLGGTEDRETAKEVIASLDNNDMTTALFEALETAADRITEKGDDGVRRLIVCISDGEDFADNTRDAGTISEKIAQDGIPVFTIAVEKHTETEEEARKNRSSFSAVAAATGGAAWTVDQLQEGQTSVTENSVKNGLDFVAATALSGSSISFRADSNRMSMKTEELLLQFPDGTKASKGILVARHQADETQPAVTGAVAAGENEIMVTYSEKVSGADAAGSYRLSLDGSVIGVTQVAAAEGQENAYVLVLSEKLVNGTYMLRISNVTDASQEANRLEQDGQDISVTVEGMEEEPVDEVAPTVKEIALREPDAFEITYSEKVENADRGGSYSVTFKDSDIAVVQARSVDEKKNKYRITLARELENGTYEIKIDGVTDASAQKNALEKQPAAVRVEGIKKKINILSLVLTWWPVLLTVVVAVLIVFLLMLRRRLKENKVTIVQGQVVRTDQISEKLHVQVEQQQEVLPVTVWISNGINEPRTIRRAVNGSMFIGRSERMCDIFCDDPMMSKQHFNVSVGEDGNLYIMDLNSRNGTMVNGVRITEKVRLQPGDEILAGSIRFRFTW